MTATEQAVWDCLKEHISNEKGIAAIMGNLKAESSMNPLCKTGKNKILTAKEYVKAVDDGGITKEEFANDGIAFGLAQWLFHSRKELLYDYAKNSKEGIGSVYTQVGYIVSEMKNYYKTAWNEVTSGTELNDICDAVMLKYEKPANTNETAKEKRRKYSKAYLEAFGAKEEETEVKEPVNTPEPTHEPNPIFIPAPAVNPSTKKYVVTTANKVFIRIGNGAEYSAITRLERKGAAAYEWVATAENGWHAFKYINRVAWVSGEFSEIIER